MKTSHKHIIAALAVTLALASCTKDVIAEKEEVNPQDGGLRTIAVSFGASTKSYLDSDGVTPKFEEGDEIAVFNGKEEETVVVDVNEKGDFYFTTSLQGGLAAIYPSKNASFEDGEWNYKVPVEQTGLFKDANIALAKIGEDASYATFFNQTAVLKFYIGPEIGVQSIIISSTNSQLATDDSKIVVEVAKLRESKVIDPQERICYVAVLPGVSQMTVESFTSTQKVENSEGYVKREFQNVNLIHNTLANVFIPYYIPVNVGTEANPKLQYWSYCNLGAFLPEETGKYFAWGATEGYKWLVKSDEGFFEDNHPFSWETCPFNDGKSEYSQEAFEAHKATVCPNGTLIADYDAAYLSWGGKWRMPTNEEIEKLYSIITPLEDVSEDGLRIKGTSLFFPLTGYGFVQDRPNRQWTDSGIYWTSSLNATAEDLAYCFNFTRERESVKYIGDSFDRPQGLPIRPIYGDPAQEQVALEINKYKEGPTL